MFTLMARVSNPRRLRAFFGMLNVVTFFPAAPLYPTESYPAWAERLSQVFPSATPFTPCGACSSRGWDSAGGPRFPDHVRLRGDDASCSP